MHKHMHTVQLVFVARRHEYQQDHLLLHSYSPHRTSICAEQMDGWGAEPAFMQFISGLVIRT